MLRLGQPLKIASLRASDRLRCVKTELMLHAFLSILDGFALIEV